MTRVCLVGSDDVNVRYELLSRETARDALSTYEISQPFENTVGIETVSLGAAVTLLNDLEWYLVRFVDEAMVLEPSVDDSEWLSRDLAVAVRDGDVDPAASDRYCKVYGLEPAGTLESDKGEPDGAGDDHDPHDRDGERTVESAPDATRADERVDAGRDGSGAEGRGGSDRAAARYRLVEPMYVTRTGDGLPTYDLRDVEATLVERVTESEFGA